MRYIAKIHVLDVMDKIIVSGYVYDADPLTDFDHVVTEFASETQSYGLDDQIEWLKTALGSFILDKDTTLSAQVREGRADGGR
jgi:hypothetical protein